MKKKLGIAFGGGGARAAAECGAVQALNEFGIKPDVVSGTSAGSIIAVLYSAGFTPAQMIEVFEGLDFFHDIITASVPKGGLFSSEPLLALLKEILPYKTIEELPIPTYIVASDLDHGKAQVFSSGELAPRVVASCSIPIVFNPIEIDGVHYVDGGVFQNLPVPAIRDLCRTVMSFSLLQLEEEEYRDNIFSVASRTFGMMMVSNIRADARLSDIHTELDTSGCNAYDMSKMEMLFNRGYQDTVQMLEANGYKRKFPQEEIVFKGKEKGLPDIKAFFKKMNDSLIQG